jgi:hypothetical protein
MPIAPVTQLEARSHNAADETRTPPKTRVEVVNLGGYALGTYYATPYDVVTKLALPSVAAKVLLTAVAMTTSPLKTY